MKLLSLRANQPSFHPIVFKDGINIIVGKQVAPLDENDGNTYNGVGKSLTLHLIHFCLGANKITSFAQKLPNWEFTLNFEIDGVTYYSTYCLEFYLQIRLSLNILISRRKIPVVLHILYFLQQVSM